MLGPAERALLCDLGRQYRGEGAIVDAGCFLGGSTHALAAGVASRKRARVPNGAIHAYDSFRLDPLYKLHLGPRVADIPVGGRFRAQFENNLGQLLDLVTVHEGDIREMRWSGEPIEILFLDICKSWEINDHVMREFFPALVPHHSIVVHQDYVHEWLPHIPVGMAFLRDRFELVGYVPPSTALFSPVADIAPADLPDSLFCLPDERKLALFDDAAAAFNGVAKGVLECARALLLLEIGRRDDAIDLVADLMRKRSVRVARGAAAVRSWILRSSPDPTEALAEWFQWLQTTDGAFQDQWLAMAAALEIAVDIWEH